jgi:hypothetical protein
MLKAVRRLPRLNSPQGGPQSGIQQGRRRFPQIKTIKKSNLVADSKKLGGLEARKLGGKEALIPQFTAGNKKAGFSSVFVEATPDRP